jgi:hypothetical protein
MAKDEAPSQQQPGSPILSLNLSQAIRMEEMATVYSQPVELRWFVYERCPPIALK